MHEGIEPHERPSVLDGDLEHELAATLREALLDTWHYAQLESRHIPAPQTARAYLVGIVLRPAAKLLYRTIVDGGWRDGWRGLLKISLDASTDGLVWVLSILRSEAGLRRPSHREARLRLALRTPAGRSVEGRGRG